LQQDKVTKEAEILQEGFSLIFCRVKLLLDSNNSMSIFLERKSACIFRVEWGRKPPSFFFSTSAKVEIRAYSKQKLPVKLIFSVQNEILGKKIQCREEGNAPKKVDFTPKPARIWRKRAPAFKCK